MTLQTNDSDWAARVAAAGVPVQLLARELDSADADALADSVLRVARDKKLCDRDLYPLLVRIWTGRQPIVDWPPHAPQVARRCAIELAVQQPCELAMSSWGPNDRSLQQARELIVSGQQTYSLNSQNAGRKAQAWTCLATERKRSWRSLNTCCSNRWWARAP
jgi:hypothetical protein